MVYIPFLFQLEAAANIHSAMCKPCTEIMKSFFNLLLFQFNNHNFLPFVTRTVRKKTPRNEQRTLVQCHDPMGQHISCVSAEQPTKVVTPWRHAKKSLAQYRSIIGRLSVEIPKKSYLHRHGTAKLRREIFENYVENIRLYDTVIVSYATCHIFA